MERFGVICPMMPEHSVQGNAVHLGCYKHDSTEIENQRELFGEYLLRATPIVWVCG
jgi:hypothetical protein